MTKDLFGKLYADNGYISQSLFASLFDRRVHIVTGIRTNMKNRLMDVYDKIMQHYRDHQRYAQERGTDCSYPPQKCLEEQWSPRQISGVLKKEGTYVSHQNIYNIIHADATGTLAQHTRHKLKYRRRPK